jgi:hypothetical protein
VLCSNLLMDYRCEDLLQHGVVLIPPPEPDENMAQQIASMRRILTDDQVINQLMSWTKTQVPTPHKL